MTERLARDDTFLRVLRAMQAKPELSGRDLAEHIGASEATVSKIRSQARSQGMIKGTSTILSREKFGFHALCFFRVTCRDQRDNAKVASVLEQNEEVQEIHVMDGAHYLLVKVCMRTAEAIEKFQSDTLRIPGVTEVRGSIAMRTIKETLAIAL